MPYGITQYYLPPGRGDIPAFTPAEAGTRVLKRYRTYVYMKAFMMPAVVEHKAWM